MASRPMTSVRIIGGAYNGRKIRVPTTAQLRPSPDRLREALFSCLGAYVHGAKCLDLFAGSGVLGLCAASRGAAHITFVEKTRHNAVALEKIVKELEINAAVVNRTAQNFLADPKRHRHTFDLVFLDPPFDDYQTDVSWQRLLNALSARLAPDASVYCESNRWFTPPVGWRTKTKRRTGRVYWQLVHPPESAPAL